MEELIKTIGIITVGNDIIKQALGSEKEEQRFVDVEGFSKQWNLEAPDVCCVCLEGATNVENILVYCDGRECEVICHQECYGITKLPAEEDPWYCDKCLAKPAEVVSCILCPKKTGAFRRLREEESFKTNAWVHLVCALWIPGMWIANTSELNECSIINVKQVNWKKKTAKNSLKKLLKSFLCVTFTPTNLKIKSYSVTPTPTNNVANQLYNDELNFTYKDSGISLTSFENLPLRKYHQHYHSIFCYPIISHFFYTSFQIKPNCSWL
ncbi:11501_t:CDS:2 [Entrophospora sp. SA101]|nr:11501_t:CDS:2 [Entrophospora sp. SA101]